MKKLILNITHRKKELTIEIINYIEDVEKYLREYLPYEMFKCKTKKNNTIIDIKKKDKDTIKKEIEMLSLDKINEIEVFPGNKYSKINKNNQICLFNSSKDHHIIANFHSTVEYIPNQIILTVDNGNINIGSIIIRIFRDIYQAFYHHYGFIMLHCSNVCKNNGSISFIGDKGAGKTAWMLKMLKQGYNYLSNDRIFMNINKRGKGLNYSYPIAIMLCFDGLKNLNKDLKDAVLNYKIKRSERFTDKKKKIGLTPMEIVKAYKCTNKNNALLNEIIILNKIKDNNEIFQINEINENNIELVKSVLKKNIYYPNDPTYMFYWITRNKSKLLEKETIIEWIIKNKIIKIITFSWTWFNQYTDTIIDV